MKRHRHYCRRCDEIFYTDRLNMNERHDCGHLAIMDWGYQNSGEEEFKKEH